MTVAKKKIYKLEVKEQLDGMYGQNTMWEGFPQAMELCLKNFHYKVA